MVTSSKVVTQSGNSPSTPRRRAQKDMNGTDTPDPAKATAPRSARNRRDINYEEAEYSAEETRAIETPKTSGRKRKAAEVVEEGLEKRSPANLKLKKVVKTEEYDTLQESKSEAGKEAEVEDVKTTPKNLKNKGKNEGEEEDKLESGESKRKRKRKTKEEKEADAMPLAARTLGLQMFFGAHVSCAKGVQNGVLNSVHIGGNAFAMFLKSQRKWENPPLQDEHRDQFKAYCTEHKYDAASHILPHGSYLVNLANPEPEAALKAYSGFIDDLHRCEALGIKYYNFHPGATGAHPRPEAIGRIAAALNKAHAATRIVVPLLETMATPGSNVIGSVFEDLRDIIALVEDKSRIGACLDTCHVFAAGYDLRSPEAFKETLDKFDKIVGMQYLKALHLNDSKAPLAAGRDLHQNIGLGFLGLRAFHNVVNEKRFENLPLVLETPIDSKDENGKEIEDKGIWAREIKMLEEMIGMDAESENFKHLEKELADKGAEERAKYQEAFQRKKDKVEKGQTKLSFGKGKKKRQVYGEDSSSEA